ncbi:MAG TPA: RNA-binding protein, partial [Thermoanaerobaculia bacterium]|nr:RNA-binding protein [Thermoanaerobaculia bacterium]
MGQRKLAMRIYIGNLPSSITDAQLRELALPFGKPQSANIARRLGSGESKGFGFIEYATDAEARAAISGLDGKVVQGQALTARLAKPAKAHPWAKD